MHIPAPEWSISPTRQLVAGVIFTVILLVALGYAVRVARQVRRPYPLYIVIAAGSIALGEPFVDVLGQCAFPEIGATPWVHAFGRVVGLYMAPVYFFYFGPAILITVRLLAKGVSARGWWRWYAGAVAFALVFEPLPIRYGWWTYFGGNQPVRFFGLPVWWAFANTAAWLMVGALLHTLLRRGLLDGPRALAIIPGLATAYMGMHTMLAFPIYLALNSSLSTVVTNLGQLATIALSLAAIWLCGRLTLGTPNRTADDSEPALEPTAR